MVKAVVAVMVVVIMVVVRRGSLYMALGPTTVASKSQVGGRLEDVSGWRTL